MSLIALVPFRTILPVINTVGEVFLTALKSTPAQLGRGPPKISRVTTVTGVIKETELSTGQSNLERSQSSRRITMADDSFSMYGYPDSFEEGQHSV